MRIPYFVFIYRVRPQGRAAKQGWRGWRMKLYYFAMRESCICSTCDTEHPEVCLCVARGPHTHTGFGWVSKGLFMPKVMQRA